MSACPPRFAAAVLVAAVVHAAPSGAPGQTEESISGGMEQARMLLGDIDRLVAAGAGGAAVGGSCKVTAARREVDAAISAIGGLVDRQQSFGGSLVGEAIAVSVIGMGADGGDADRPCTEPASLYLSGSFNGSTLQCFGTGSTTVIMAGNDGGQMFTFASGTTLADIANALASFTEQTGVSAALLGDGIGLTSTEAGSEQFVAFHQIEGEHECLLTLTEPGGEPASIDVGVTGFQADIDCDFIVGPSDLAVLLGHWGECLQEDCAADLDGDGEVGPADLAIVLANWF